MTELFIHVGNPIGNGFYKPLGIHCWTQLWGDQCFDRTSYSVSSNLYFCPQDRVCWQIFGIELLYSVSSETLVWCFYKVLVKLIFHIDFLIHSFNTWTFSIVLRHQKSNPVKISRGSHLPTALETIKQNRFTVSFEENTVGSVITGRIHEPLYIPLSFCRPGSSSLSQNGFTSENPAGNFASF